jgi:hypothetical protein
MAGIPAGAPMNIRTVGSDQAALVYLDLTPAAYSACYQEALLFMCKTGVQQQINRVARALNQRRTVTLNEVRDAAQFTVSLASAAWQS